MNAGWSMLIWAARDLGRKPGLAILTGLVIATLVAFSATTLLLIEAWSTTTESLIESGPSLVVRRVSPTGWSPMPLGDVVSRTAAVIGVVAVEPRIWGAVSGPEGPLTVVGVSQRAADTLSAQGFETPKAGEAIAGPGALHDHEGDTIKLAGTATLELQLINTLPKETALALHDMILVTPGDARLLLGLAPHEASDLAVSVFHEAEEEAILPDLAASFSFPVRITTRREAAGATAGIMSRDGGLATMLLAPALLAMALLITNTLRDSSGSRRDLGLYKTFGWTSGDLVRLQVLKSLAIGVPAILVGLGTAWLLVFWPGITWPGALLLGWQTPPPPLTLSSDGAARVMLTVTGLVLSPWLLATLVPAVRSTLADPDDLVRGGR